MSTRNGTSVRGLTIDIDRGEETMGNCAGLDWAAEKHDVRIADEHGRTLCERVIDHSEAGIAELVDLLLKQQVERLAIERPDGLLVGRLVAAGIVVLAIHPNQVKAARDRFRPAGGDQPADQEAVGALDREPLDLLLKQQVERLGDPCLAVVDHPLTERPSVLVGDPDIVLLSSPIKARAVAHRFFSSVDIDRQAADRGTVASAHRQALEGQRPVVALGASHRREALVSCGPSERQARPVSYTHLTLPTIY